MISVKNTRARDENNVMKLYDISILHSQLNLRILVEIGSNFCRQSFVKSKQRMELNSPNCPADEKLDFA